MYTTGEMASLPNIHISMCTSIAVKPCCVVPTSNAFSCLKKIIHACNDQLALNYKLYISSLFFKTILTTKPKSF